MIRGIVIGVALMLSAATAGAQELRPPDVFYVPTPQVVVDAMLATWPPDDKMEVAGKTIYF